MNTPIKEAFDSLRKQGNGKIQTMITQAVEYRPNPVGERIRALKNLVYNTFVRMQGAPSDVPRQKYNLLGRDIYLSARERIKDLGVNGGIDYETVTELVRDAWTSTEAWECAVDFITDKVAMEIAVATRVEADPVQEELARRVIAKLKKDAGIMMRA